jgi:hypothetical protein
LVTAFLHLGEKMIGNGLNALESAIWMTSTATQGAYDYECFGHLGGVFDQYCIGAMEINRLAACATQVTFVVPSPGIRRSGAKEGWSRYTLLFHA